MGGGGFSLVLPLSREPLGARDVARARAYARAVSRAISYCPPYNQGIRGVLKGGLTNWLPIWEFARSTQGLRCGYDVVTP
jgi:hypothetical protein